MIPPFRRFILFSALLLLFHGGVGAQENLIELEQTIQDEMRRVLILQSEIRSKRSDASQLDRKVSEAKRSGHLIDRLMLSGKLKELHQMMAEIQRMENEARGRRQRVQELFLEASYVLRIDRSLDSDEKSARRKRLELISGYRLTELRRELRTIRSRHESGLALDPERLRAEFERVKAEFEKVRAEFHAYYNYPIAEE